MDNIELKQRFEPNPYIRGGLSIAEGVEHMKGIGFSGEGALSLTPSKLVDTKPKKETNYLVASFDSLSGIEEAYLASLGGKAPRPVAKEVYQRIRSNGSAYRQLADGVDLVDYQYGMQVNRQEDYYASVTELGEYFFNEMPSELMKNTLRLTVGYNMISGYGQVCSSASSMSYECNISVKLKAKEMEAGQPVTWLDDYSNPPVVFNQKFRDVSVGNTSKSEDVCSALGLPRSSDNESGISIIRDYMNTSLNSSVLCRFVVMELMRLRLHLSSTDRLEIPLNTSVLRFGNNVTGISDCISGLSSNVGSVVNTVGMDEDEARILVRSALGYKMGDFQIDGEDLYLGGFHIPSEVVGTRGLGYISDINIPNITSSVTSNQIYNAMLKYASKMNAHQEMQDARVLAGALVMSDELPNFSLPRPQGYVDVVAAAVEKKTGGVLVPPSTINTHTLLGGLVIVRQSLLCVADISAYTCIPNNGQKSARAYLSATERQNMYSWFKENRFSDAFSVTRIIDPICMISPRATRRADSIVFPTVAWAAINNHVFLKNSYSQFFFQGEWASRERMEKLDPEEQRLVLSTYMVNGLIQNVRTLGSRVTGGVPDTEHVRVSDLQEGRVGTIYLDMSYTTKMSRSDRTTMEEVAFTKQVQVENEYPSVMQFELDEAPYESDDESVAQTGAQVPAAKAQGQESNEEGAEVAETPGITTSGGTPPDEQPAPRVRSRGPKTKKSSKTRPVIVTKSFTQLALGHLLPYLRAGVTDPVVSLSTRWRRLVARVLSGGGRGEPCLLAGMFGAEEVPKSRQQDWKCFAKLVRTIVSTDQDLIPSGAGRLHPSYAYGHAMVAEAVGYSKPKYKFRHLPLGGCKTVREALRKKAKNSGVTVIVAGIDIQVNGWPVSKDFDKDQYVEMICAISRGYRDPDSARLLVGVCDDHALATAIPDEGFCNRLAEWCRACITDGELDESDD